MHASKLDAPNETDERDDSENPSAPERPTIPAPRRRAAGHLRIAVARCPTGAATVDEVACDLAKDPRSEDYRPQSLPARLFDWDSLSFNEAAWAQWEAPPPKASEVRLRSDAPEQESAPPLRRTQR